MPDLGELDSRLGGFSVVGSHVGAWNISTTERSKQIILLGILSCPNSQSGARSYLDPTYYLESKPFDKVPRCLNLNFTWYIYWIVQPRGGQAQTRGNKSNESWTTSRDTCRRQNLSRSTGCDFLSWTSRKRVLSLSGTRWITRISHNIEMVTQSLYEWGTPMPSFFCYAFSPRHFRLKRRYASLNIREITCDKKWFSLEAKGKYLHVQVLLSCTSIFQLSCRGR
jgi:hypothetical protein